MKYFTCDFENRTFLYHALQKRGGVIQNIAIGHVGARWIEASSLGITGAQIANILRRVNDLNPRALTNIRFGTSDHIWMSFDLSKRKRRTEPLHSRIVGLNFKRVGPPLEEASAIANLAMRCIPSLKRVTIRWSTPCPGTEATLIRLIQNRIEEHDLMSLEDISILKPRNSYEINMVLCRRGEPPEQNPRLGFQSFLKGMRKYELL